MNAHPTRLFRRSMLVCAAALITLVPAVAATQEQVDFAAQLYADLLGRPIDHRALLVIEGMFNAGGARSQISSLVTSSQEFRAIEVQAYYHMFLNRAASPSEVRSGVQMLDMMLEENFEAQGLGSDEFFRLAGGTNPGWVELLYRDVLNRPASPDEQRAALDSIGLKTERSLIALLILNSEEHRRLVVSHIYQLLLRRPPTAQELDRMQGAILHGASDRFVIDFVAGSEEYLRFVEMGSPHSVVPCI